MAIYKIYDLQTEKFRDEGYSSREEAIESFANYWYNVQYHELSEVDKAEIEQMTDEEYINSCDFEVREVKRSEVSQHD